MSTNLATSKQAIATTPVHPAPPAAATATARDHEPSRSADQAVKLLARSLGRQAARRHIARGWSMIEVALPLAVAALALAAALYLQMHIGRLP